MPKIAGFLLLLHLLIQDNVGEIPKNSWHVQNTILLGFLMIRMSLAQYFLEKF